MKLGSKKIEWDERDEKKEVNVLNGGVSSKIVPIKFSGSKINTFSFFILTWNF